MRKATTTNDEEIVLKFLHFLNNSDKRSSLLS